MFISWSIVDVFQMGEAQLQELVPPAAHCVRLKLQIWKGARIDRGASSTGVPHATGGVAASWPFGLEPALAWALQLNDSGTNEANTPATMQTAVCRSDKEATKVGNWISSASEGIATEVKISESMERIS